LADNDFGLLSQARRIADGERCSGRGQHEAPVVQFLAEPHGSQPAQEAAQGCNA
jgi:hypothetical protein